jgi:hypothetical protein
MEPKNLKGAMPKGSIGAKDGNGNVIDPDVAIFPILSHDKENFNLIGTGFFITNDGLFITAKHVLLDAIDENGAQTKPLMLIQFSDGGYTIRPITRSISHDIADISIGLSAPMRHNTTGTTLKNKKLNLNSHIPDEGKDIFTYAYPKTVIKHSEVPELHFYSDCFRGLIQKYYPDGRDSVLLPGPCVQTSMYVHGGASGGPVFDLDGNVFGVNSTGFENEDLSFVTPIHTIENLLLTDVLIPNNSSGQVSMKELIDGGFISYGYYA